MSSHALSLRPVYERREKNVPAKIADTDVYKRQEYIQSVSRIFIVACGSSYHVGMVSKYNWERLLRRPVEVCLASEFRYCDPLVDDHSLVIFISQSGETLDTMAALREAKRRGGRTLAVVNVVGSSIAREADDVLYTWAGPEIAVATTKAYSTQLVLMDLIALYLGCLLYTSPLGHRGKGRQDHRFLLRPQPLYRLPHQPALPVL